MSAGDLNELTPDRPASIDRFSGEQLAGNAQAVRRVPLDAPLVGRDEPRHDAEHGPALIEQQLLDLPVLQLFPQRGGLSLQSLQTAQSILWRPVDVGPHGQRRCGRSSA